MNRDLQKIDLLIERGDIRKAEVLIAKKLRTHLIPQEQIGLLSRRARVRLLSARPEDALSDVLEIHSLSSGEPIPPDILELKGDIYISRFELASVGFADRHDTELAEETYKQLVSQYPRYNNLGWVYYQLGRIRIAAGDIESATHYFHQSLLSPGTVNTLSAYCYERLAFIAFDENRDVEQCLAFLNRAIDTYPTHADRNWLVQVHLLRARVLRSQRNYPAALIAAEAALSIVSGNRQANKANIAEILLAVAELKSELGNREREIIQLLQQFMQNAKKPLGVDVTWGRVNEMLGNAYFNLEQYENAIEAYQTVFQFNPDHPWEVSLYYRIAQSHYQRRQYEQAVNALYQMIEAAQREEQSINDYRVYDMLGNALFALGRYDRAIEAYRTALQIAPVNADNLALIQSYHDLARDLA